MDDSGTGLPASIEAAWGLRARPSKGPKPGLSLDRIVQAAIKVAGSEGIEAVSMHRVATELGTKAMSLYRYVGSKDELLQLMVDAALGAPPEARPGEGWREGLSRWAWAEHERYRQHPWVLRVPISGPPFAPNQVAWVEQGLRWLRGTGLAEGEKMSVILLVTGYVRNQATIIADIDAAALAGGPATEEAMIRYGRTLSKLIDPERFPALSATIASGVLDEEDDDFGEVEFVFGLERVLDGIGALVRERAADS
jgi:AcrR family transcriptional regulator